MFHNKEYPGAIAASPAQGSLLIHVSGELRSEEHLRTHLGLNLFPDTAEGYSEPGSVHHGPTLYHGGSLLLTHGIPSTEQPVCGETTGGRRPWNSHPLPSMHSHQSPTTPAFVPGDSRHQVGTGAKHRNGLFGCCIHPLPTIAFLKHYTVPADFFSQGPSGDNAVVSLPPCRKEAQRVNSTCSHITGCLKQSEEASSGFLTSPLHILLCPFLLFSHPLWMGERCSEKKILKTESKPREPQLFSLNQRLKEFDIALGRAC